MWHCSTRRCVICSFLMITMPHWYLTSLLRTVRTPYTTRLRVIMRMKMPYRRDLKRRILQVQPARTRATEQIQPTDQAQVTKQVRPTARTQVTEQIQPTARIQVMERIRPTTRIRMMEQAPSTIRIQVTEQTRPTVRIQAMEQIQLTDSNERQKDI